MDWTDLKLDKKFLRALREEYGIEAPEQVIKLAWGAPTLLERVLPADTIKRMRKEFPASKGSDFDSSQFAMGSRFGVPLAWAFHENDQFEKVRSDLLAKLEHEKSPTRRAALEFKLQKLYER